MNKTFLKSLKDAEQRSFEQGQASILIIALIAGYNVWEGETEDYAKFAKKWEHEVQTFFGENGDKFGKELPEVVFEKAKELRKILRMDDE